MSTKGKIDLNNLLLKYQTGTVGNTQRNFLDTKRQMDVNEQFYGRKRNQTLYQNVSHTSNYGGFPNGDTGFLQARDQGVHETYIGNFKMSKQQCESFLSQIKNELKKQRNHLNYHSETVLTQISKRFSQNHERIKKQVLQLLDHAFRQNQKQLRQQLAKQSKYEPTEFNRVYKTISQVQSEIQTYMHQLRSNDYRKAIAQVVLKDFTQQIDRLKQSIRSAKAQYIDGLGEVEPDRTRIDCIKNDLHNLFYFKKKTAKVVEKSIFSILGGGNQNQSPVKNDFDRIDQQSRKQRGRKSFFHFGRN